MTFQYFDGREDAHDHCYEFEADAVEIETEIVETMVHEDGFYRDEFTVWVEPPCRYAYPRPVETVAEARALYLGDEISILQFESYLEEVFEA